MKVVISKNSKIQGLIIKDLLQLKSYKRTLISFILIFAIVSVLQALSGGGIGFLSILPVMITVGFGMFSIASFNYDESAKADRYIRSLPINVKEIVLSKYIFAIGATVIGALVRDTIYNYTYRSIPRGNIRYIRNFNYIFRWSIRN